MRTLSDLVFFIIQNPSNLVELKNCIGRGFRGIWLNFPNPIYVVIILAKLKVHYL